MTRMIKTVIKILSNLFSVIPVMYDQLIVSTSAQSLTLNLRHRAHKWQEKKSSFNVCPHLQYSISFLSLKFHPVLPGITDSPVLAHSWLSLITWRGQTAGHVITIRNDYAVVNYEGRYLLSSRENGSFHFITQPNWVIVLPCNTEIVRKPFYTLWISMKETQINMSFIIHNYMSYWCLLSNHEYLYKPESISRLLRCVTLIACKLDKLYCKIKTISSGNLKQYNIYCWKNGQKLSSQKKLHCIYIFFIISYWLK